MVMMDCLPLSPLCFRPHPESACLVHKQRNVMNAIPHRERKEVEAELQGIWKQEKKEDALLNLAAGYPRNTKSAIPKPYAA